jgi:STE24 endopeptidase
MYLVVIGILALILTLSGPVYRILADPGQILAAVAAATLLPPAVGLLVTRRVLRTLERYPDVPSHGQATFGRGMVAIQFLLAACHGGVFAFTDWQPLCDRTPVVGTWPLVPALLALVPFLLSIVLIWLAVYAADRAVRQIALEVYLFRGKPVRPVWPLFQYVLYNLRHQVLFILVPMLLIVAADDFAQRYRKDILRTIGVPHADELLVGLAALLVAVVTPEILRHVWVTQRLPDGPLRDRLVRLAGILRLRCREILVWRSGGMIVNAAVMGVVAPLRYVLITDGMLEQMDDTKIEAVFGHEAGHIKRHHILYFLLFAFISGCIVTIFSIRTQDLARGDHTSYQVMLTGLTLVLAAKWGLIFGWISRRFERQADMFGVRTLALGGVPCALPCAVHTPAENPGAPQATSALCSTAAHIFADALHEVAVLNGIRPEARSWRHSSIANRSRLLQDFALHPVRAARFERVVLAVKATIFTTALVGGAWAAYELRLWATLLHWLRGA